MNSKTFLPNPPAELPRGIPAAQITSGLQSLRVLATLLVVAGHSMLAYLNAPLRGTAWHVLDESSCLTFGYLAMATNAFAMPIFFFMAGTSAISACTARGPARFFKHRSSKLIAPAIVACVTILPLSYLFWGLGLLVTEQATMHDVLRMKFAPEIQRFAYGPMHLWFLEYLVIISGLWAVAWQVGLGRFLQRPRVIAECQRVLGSRWAPFVIAIPTALVFLLQPDTMIRMANTFVPDPWRLAHYTIYFIVGAAWSRGASVDPNLGTRWPLFALAAIGLYAFEGSSIVAHATGLLGQEYLTPLCVTHAVFGWCVTLALVEGSIALAGHRSLRTHYWAEASFWIYLFHHPVVAAFQFGLVFVSLPALAKFGVTWLGSVAITLLAYEYLVRYSQVGEWINGVRKRAIWKRPWHAEVAWMTCVLAVLTALGGFIYSYRGFIWNDNFAEVVPEAIYRSGRLKATRLASLMERYGIQTVLCVDEDVNTPWLAEQEKICAAQHGELRHIPLQVNALPTESQLTQLASILATCPGPVLIEGYKGIDRTSLAAAVAVLVQCGDAEEAQRQFSVGYGELAGQAHTPLAHVIHDYRAWIDHSGCPTGPISFEVWATEQYPALSARCQRSQFVLRRPTTEFTALREASGKPVTK
jgi:surface polysaccharide O-acyltransferase-like enzyme